MPQPGRETFGTSFRAVEQLLVRKSTDIALRILQVASRRMVTIAFDIKGKCKCHVALDVSIRVKPPCICLGTFVIAEEIACLFVNSAAWYEAVSGAATYCSLLNALFALELAFVFAAFSPQCGSHRRDEPANQWLATSTTVGVCRGYDGGGGCRSGGGAGAPGVAPCALAPRPAEPGLAVRGMALSTLSLPCGPGLLCGSRWRFPSHRERLSTPIYPFTFFLAHLDILICQPPISSLQYLPSQCPISKL